MSIENEKPVRKSSAPKFEVILILILFACFIMWSISRCGDKRASYQEEQAIINGDEVTEETNNELANENKPPAQNTPTVTTPVPTPAPVTSPPPKQDLGAMLYVTIDGLNMRDYPHLDSIVTAKLPLFEQVVFLNEVTDFKQEINLGKEMANEPWVKVQTKRGKQGWVYGAGVHYHKAKRKGVE